MKIGLVIPVFNRPEYVRRCFESLEAANMPKGTIIVVVDDASTVDMSSLSMKHKWLVNNKNEGVKYSLLRGVESAISVGAEIIINLDSDAIVKPDFMQSLLELNNRTGMISSGFNNPKEPILNQFEAGYIVKAHANGINMCFNLQQYHDFIEPALKGAGNWDFEASKLAGTVAITIPSVVQHIGLQSSMGHIGADVAQDFKQLSLPSVTLFGIDSHDVRGIERAAAISQRDIEFGAVNIITQDLFTKGGNNELRRNDYSRFMLKELTKHFTTSHVLTIHADGYVVNFNAWADEWLQYDYIGATWLYKDGMNVGNGGFSLRSKKLCDILAENQIEHIHPEDHCICRIYRKSLEEDFGIKFAPADVADKFSIEAYGSNAIRGANMYSGQFGFHSRHVDFSQSGLPQEILLPAVYSQAQKTFAGNPKNAVHLTR